MNGEMSQTSFRMALLEEASLGSFPAYMAGDAYESYSREEPSSHPQEDMEEEEEEAALEDVHLDAYEAIVAGGTTKKAKTMKDQSDASLPEQEDDDEEDQLSSSEHSEGASTVDKAEENEKKVRMSLLFAILSACGMIAIGSQMGKLMNCLFKRSGDGGNGEDDVAGMAGDLAGDMVDNVQQG